MGKQYKITYRVYPNERLKEVPFHNETTHPIYIIITYRRRNLIFKSYYFDLFSKPRYATLSDVKQNVPTVKDIVEMDRRVLDYLAGLPTDEDTTVEQLVQWYYFYSLDLCTSSEEAFNVSLFLLLRETGTGAFARALAVGSSSELLYNVVQDMAGILRPDVYEHLLSEMLKMRHFYLQLYGFVLEYGKPPYLFLSVLDWATGTTKADFMAYLQGKGTDNPDDIAGYVDHWVAYLRKSK